MDAIILFFRQIKHANLCFFIALSFALHLYFAIQQHYEKPTIQHGMPLTIRTSKKILPRSIKNKKQVVQKDVIGTKKYEEQIIKKEDLKVIKNVDELDDELLETEKVESTVDEQEIVVFTQGLEQLLNQYLARIDLRKYYPRSAIRRGIQGVVLVRLVFDSKGELVDIALEKSSKSKALDRSGLKLILENKDAILAQLRQTEWPKSESDRQYPIVAPISFVLN